MSYLTDEQINDLLEVIQTTAPTEKERERYLKVLIADRTPAPLDDTNGDLCTPKFIAEYQRIRSKNLSRKEAALLMKISMRQLDDMLRGVGLSTKQHTALLWADAAANVALKDQLLEQLITSARQGNDKATTMLLEKLWPDQYGNTLKVTNKVDMRLTAEELAEKSKQAAEALRKLRREKDGGRID